MLIAKNKPIDGSNVGRTIGVRTHYVRGRIAERQEYESLLERDFLTLLRVDPSVESFVTQPIKIPYTLAGRPSSYTPDVLVKFKPDSQGITCRVPCDHVPVRSWALFRAREVMRGLIESFIAEQPR